MKMKALYFLLLLTVFVSCNNADFEKSTLINEEAEIFPDYSGVVLPHNIAPINFIIKDSAEDYYVEFIKEGKKVFGLSDKTGNIQIPMNKWRKIINKASDFSIAIYAKRGSTWYKYNTIINTISSFDIDGFVVYRFINAANILWQKMGIYQRDLSSFEVKPIMDNDLTEQNCMHCHSFAANNAESFMLHMRGKPGGTVIYTDGKLKFVDTKTEFTFSAGGYPAWHPNGKLIAFSNNKINQRFHADPKKYAFVYDEKSDIVLYDVDKNEIQAIDELSNVEFENMPTWSPDGKFLYFLSSEYYDAGKVPYNEIKYDLKRIAFNVENNKWGVKEDVLLSKKINKSVAFPRVSPDNRYVVMCLADYGYFTVYNETSDIYILDLEQNKLFKPDINSDGVESYPSWSSNGKWIMFNSKRADGISSRPYFSFFENGKAHKPFILPQEDANWNIEELFNINRPELVKTEVKLTPQKILNLVKEQPVKANFDKSTLKFIKDQDSKHEKNDLYELAN